MLGAWDRPDSRPSIECFPIGNSGPFSAVRGPRSFPLGKGSSGIVYVAGMRTLVWIAVALGACALTVLLGDAWFRGVPLAVAALVVSIGAFGPDERPLPPGTHELGVAPRAVVQGVACALVYALVWGVVWCATWQWTLNEALVDVGAELESGLFIVLPAFVETKERTRSRSLRRDALAACFIYAAAFVALVLGGAAMNYSFGAVHTSTSRGLEALRSYMEFVPDAHFIGPTLVKAMVFVPPALARLRGTRPRGVVLAALGGAVLVAVLEHRASTPWAAVLTPLSPLPRAIALSLGPALADRLVRRIEPRSS